MLLKAPAHAAAARQANTVQQEHQAVQVAPQIHILHAQILQDATIATQAHIALQEQAAA